MKKIIVTADKSDRLLKILEKQAPEYNYSSFVKALRQKDIIVNGARQKENIIVPKQCEIICYVDDSALKKNMFDIVYSDDNLVIINKASGIETCDGNYNMVSELGKQGLTVFPVHRLDRNTLGLVIFAKSIEIQKKLIEEFKSGNVSKLYYAEVVGNPQKKATLRGYLVKDKDESVVKVYDKKVPGSDSITTKYETIKQNGNVALLKVEIKEGKTHQIRAHLAYNKLYIIGDGKYGKNEINTKYKAKTQHLKAYKILFNLADNSLKYLNNLELELDNRF